MAIFVAPTQNFLSKTLNGAITNNATTITLSSTTGMQAPGYVVVDRVDASGNPLPSSGREIISYTGISGNDLTGCVRGADNGSGVTHADGAVVETTLTVGMWNGLATAVDQFADANGYIRAINSPVSVAIAQLKTLAVSSIASIAELRLGTRIDVSSASVTGIGLFPVFRAQGLISGATTALGGLLVIPKYTSFSWFSVITRTVASGASVVFDFMKNGTSIFAGVTKPTIVGGGTFVSTASINTKGFVPGDVLRFDVSAAAGAITDVTGQGRGD